MIRPGTVRALLVCAMLGALSATAAMRARPAQEPTGVVGGRWFKGNTHTHTLNSDGDSTPDDVVRWYREHGYNFLVLTDHNYLTSVAGLNTVHGAAEKFIVIPGEEVTMSVDSKPVHVNGLDLAALVPPPQGDTVLQALQRAIDGIRGAGGVPHINHPNYGWAITAEDLAHVERTRLFEIYNGHPQVNNAGGGGVPGLEEVWDRLLTGGRVLFGIAVDDAHHFKRPGDPTASGPGRGWVYVHAASLEPKAIVEALDRGDFYASTGVELSEYAASSEEIALKIRVTPSSRYRVQFIGRGGRVLSEQTTDSARYVVKGDEGYVRARILESNGLAAWTQPVMVGSAAR